MLHKDTEQKSFEITQKADHTMKVLQYYNHENEKSRKIIELSNEVLQESYFVLNGNMLMTDKMRDKFSQIYKIHDQRGVKFSESDEIFEISENHNQADYLFDGDHLTLEFSGDEIATIGNKRSRDATGDEFDLVPSKKRVVRSIFDDQKNCNSNKEHMNVTFAIKPTGDRRAVKGAHSATRALKENNPNVHKGFTMPKPVPKPTITKIKAMPVAAQKENKRTPSKIRRSPRSVSADPLGRSE